MEDGFQATRVTEWEEPQAVIGSYLHRYSYPDYWKLHVDQNGKELKNWVRGKIFDKKGSGETHALEEFANIVQDTSGRSEERRVGKACVRTCSSRWSADH